MARRLIGLDVGTNAVTVAEVTNGGAPRLTAFGQVALPRDAMHEGEVVDAEALVEAVKRLRTEVGVRKAPVRLGIASPRLIVRQVEMPVMSREDLAGALRFQLADLIPIPVDEALVDFAVLDEAAGSTEPGAEPVMRVLLAAAQRSIVERLVDAVERGGLPVESVELIPLALIRSLAAPEVPSTPAPPPLDDNIPGEGDPDAAFRPPEVVAPEPFPLAEAVTAAAPPAGAEGIVSIGGGVTCVVVHERGVPRFVRVLASGGRALTDAIGTALELPPETAESLKRQVGSVDDEVVRQARAAAERPLAVLLDEIRSSLDYYRNQPGAARLLRVQLTGGGAQYDGIQERLGALLGVPVEPANPRERVAVSDIGFNDDELPRLDPYLSAALGLAMPGDGNTPRLDLAPEEEKAHLLGASRNAVIGAIAAAVLIALLAIPVVSRHNDASNANSAAKAQEQKNDALEAQVNKLAPAEQTKAQIAALDAQVANLLSTDVSWASVLNEIARTMPDSVWLTSFQGSTTASTTGSGASTPTTTTPTTGAPGSVAPPPAVQGSVTFQATGLDFTAVADWIKRVGDLPEFSNLWVPSAQKSTLGDRDVVTFQSSAGLTDKARSDRSVAADNAARETK
ncbi:MAG TPA: pilus assembly protein PilM [Acidimicrobiia bacterium]